MSYNSEKVKRWRIRSKQKMVDAMGGKCQCCGYDKCNGALDFHHIDPAEKDFGFGAYRANPKSWSIVVEELRKCILLCKNCHTEVHAGQRELPSAFATFSEPNNRQGTFVCWFISNGKKYNKHTVCFLREAEMWVEIDPDVRGFDEQF